MRLLNLIEIDTRWGYRSFELYCGDITKMDKPVDLLAFSVLEGSYSPTQNSVVGALVDHHRFDLENLARSSEFDLRQAFGCWVSQELTNTGYKRLLCVELLGELETEVIIENVFVMLSILEAKGIAIKEFVLPILGTGNLGLDFDEIVKPLLEHSLNYLQRSQSLERIIFIEIDEPKAAQLDQSMDAILGRVRTVSLKGNNIDELRKRIGHQLENVRLLLHGSDIMVVNDLHRVLSDPESRLLEIDTASRKLLEAITSQMTTNLNKNLYDKIEEIRKAGRVSEWVPYYMHLIRTFGNNALHANDASKNRNPELATQDIEIGLLCLSRVIHSWSENLRFGALKP